MHLRSGVLKSSGLLATVLVTGVVGLLVVPIFRPQLGAYVSIAAIGFALALQKYVASFAGYFVLKGSRLFGVGDRIRIGSIKGDVRHIGLLHFILDEVGEGEKLGGELTGRILHIPNHIVLDQPVLNFSQDFSSDGRFIACEYMFDEVRIPVSLQSDLERASRLLAQVMQEEDAEYVEAARRNFGPEMPNFLEELEKGPRTNLHVEAQRVWLIGRFVAPIRGRNDLKSRIVVRFLEKVRADEHVLLA